MLPTRNPTGRVRVAALSLAVLAVLAGPSLAQDPAVGGPLPAAPAAPQELDAVRVIGHSDDPQSSTGSAYVLSARELDKFGSANANDVLASVPGVYTREENALGFFPRISVRASSAGRSDRISLLEDGIPAAMAPYANTSAYFFPNIGRMHMVEVLKGPETLLHGPQTTSGVVNLISTPIPAHTGGSAAFELGSFNDRRLHAHHGGSAGQWGWLVETWQHRTDGPQQLDRSRRDAGMQSSEAIAKLRWTSADDARFQQQAELKLQYADDTGNVSYLGLTDADFRANPNRRYGLGELEQMRRGRKGTSLRHRIGFGENLSLSSAVYRLDTHRHYDRLNQVEGIGLGSITNRIQSGNPQAAHLQGVLDGHLDTTHANGVRYGHNHQAFRAQGVQTELLAMFGAQVEHELTVGARYHEDTTGNAVNGIGNSVYQQRNGSLVFERTEAATPSHGDARAWSVWLADRIRIGDWTLLPIVRHEDIRTRANLVANPTPEQRAARRTNALSKTTAGLGMNYAINADWTVLGGIHQGFAPPGNNAAAGTRGEESLNLEGGLRFRSGSVGVDAIGFHTDYRNAMRACLVANPCPGGAIDGTEQTGRKQVYGLELGAFANLYDNGNLRIPVRAAWTWTDGEYTHASDTGSVLKGDVIEYTPKHTGTLQLGAEAGRWRNYLALHYSDGAWTDNSAGRIGVDTTLLRTQSLFTANLSSHYRLSEAAEAYARIDNLFDQQRITHRGADGARGNAPRSLSVGLRLTF
ncbi:MAG: TonB-dependent receptor [Pseudoxanthomonas suwonensis]|nr:TonB-dependent receptor [Pseudoxanthomonas suwonensis]